MAVVKTDEKSWKVTFDDHDSVAPQVIQITRKNFDNTPQNMTFEAVYKDTTVANDATTIQVAEGLSQSALDLTTNAFTGTDLDYGVFATADLLKPSTQQKLSGIGDLRVSVVKGTATTANGSYVTISIGSDGDVVVTKELT